LNTSIGVDAGGSKVSVRLIDVDLNVSHVLVEPCNVRIAGVPSAASAITRCVQKALCEAGAVATDVGVAVAGCGDPAVRLALGSALQDALGVPALVMSDAEAALEAHRSAGPAAVLIAGTGAIALMRNAAGETSRVGGTGAAGGDPGSGTALTTAALEVATQNRSSAFAVALGDLVAGVPERLVDLEGEVEEARNLLRETASQLLDLLSELAEPLDHKGVSSLIPLGLHGGLLLGSSIVQSAVIAGIIKRALPFDPSPLNRPSELGASLIARRVFGTPG
jgi:hypothetical protein